MCLIPVAVSTEDPCDSNGNLTFLYERSPDQGGSNLCDRYTIDGNGEWFRNYGYELVTTAPVPPFGKCGTQFPYWGAGKHIHVFY